MYPRLAKGRLRADLLRRRRDLAPETAARLSGQIRDRLAGLTIFRRARCVLAYASFRNEVDTWGIMAMVRAAGVVLALPRVERGGRLSLCRVDDPATDLAPGAHGIAEPVDGSPALAPGAVDLILVPGAGFDRHGNRLGWGGGYYDRLLAGLRAGAEPAPPAVGLAYHFQLLDRLPVGPGDQPVDMVVTEQGIFAGGEELPAQ